MLGATTREHDEVETRLATLKEQREEMPDTDLRGIAFVETEIHLAEKQLKGVKKELEKYQGLSGLRPTTSRAKGDPK